jgi:phage terminase small subunit
MPRRAFPADYHVLSGNPNRLTKAEIEARKKSEIHLGDQNFKMPATVRKNKHAAKKWKGLIKLYKDYEIEFVSTSDTSIIERYCLTYAAYMQLIETAQEIDSREDLTLEEKMLKRKYLNIDYDIRKTAAMLTPLEDRLFLNPLAKIKNVTKRIPEKDQKKDPLSKLGFGHV